MGGKAHVDELSAVLPAPCHEGIKKQVEFVQVGDAQDHVVEGGIQVPDAGGDAVKCCHGGLLSCLLQVRRNAAVF
jgi:hypothetical protein